MKIEEENYKKYSRGHTKSPQEKKKNGPLVTRRIDQLVKGSPEPSFGDDSSDNLPQSDGFSIFGVMPSDKGAKSDGLDIGILSGIDMKEGLGSELQMASTQQDEKTPELVEFEKYITDTIGKDGFEGADGSDGSSESSADEFINAATVKKFKKRNNITEATSKEFKHTQSSNAKKRADKPLFGISTASYQP